MTRWALRGFTRLFSSKWAPPPPRSFLSMPPTSFPSRYHMYISFSMFHIHPLPLHSIPASSSCSVLLLSLSFLSPASQHSSIPSLLCYLHSLSLLAHALPPSFSFPIPSSGAPPPSPILPSDRATVYKKHRNFGINIIFVQKLCLGYGTFL